MSYRNKPQSLTEPEKFRLCISGTAERMERGRRCAILPKGIAVSRFSRPPEVSIPAEFVPFLSERCAYAPYSFAGVFGVLHFFTPGVCLLSGLSVREARSRSVLSAKAARSRAALDDTAAPLSFHFPLSESVHRFRGRCFLAGSSHFL